MYVRDVHAMTPAQKQPAPTKKLLASLKEEKEKLDELTSLLRALASKKSAPPGPKKFTIVANAPESKQPVLKVAVGSAGEPEIESDEEMIVTPSDPESVGAAADQLYDAQIKKIGAENSEEAVDLMMIESSYETAEESDAEAKEDKENIKAGGA